jgi:purine nucleosidase
MARPEVEQRFQHPILRPVLDFAGVWFQHTNKITFHDPLAATTIFDESICGFDRGTVRVELKEDKRVGATCWSPDPSGSHEVALRVRPERFFDHFFSVFQ